MSNKIKNFKKKLKKLKVKRHSVLNKMKNDFLDQIKSKKSYKLLLKQAAEEKSSFIHQCSRELAQFQYLLDHRLTVFHSIFQKTSIKNLFLSFF
jgi:hypothetical protein